MESSENASATEKMGLYSNDTLSISQLRLLYPDMQTCLDDEVIDQLTEELSGGCFLDPNWEEGEAVGQTAFWLKLLSRPINPQLRSLKLRFLDNVASLAYSNGGGKKPKEENRINGGVSNGISSPPILPGGFPLDYGSSQMGGFVTDTIPRAPVFPITTSKPRLGKRSIDSLLEAKISALGANEAFGEGPMSEGAVATPMQCPHCPYTASYESRINSHIRNVHSVEKAYKCTQCDFASAVAQSLSRHINAVHSDTQSNPDEKCKGVHVCALCGYRAAGKNILELHINGVHLKSKPHKCPHCSYTSAYPQYIPKHIAAVHEKRKPYSCDLCDYKSSSKQYLAKHCDAVHHNIKPHCCPHCPYSTSYSQYLSKHISAVHKDEKPYRCPYCDYRCAYKQYLPKHISFMHKDKTPLEETVKTEPMEETVPGMNQNGEQLSAVALTGTSPH